MEGADPDHSQFTMSEWETILRHRAEANEERKREYIRWTAAGLASIAALSGLVLPLIAGTRFGSHQYVSLIVLFVTSYLIIEMAWQLIAEKILQAVYMFLGVPPPGNVWDLVNYPGLAARMSLFSILWEFGINLAVTVIVALAGVAISSPASGWLIFLAGVRFVSITLLFFSFWIARSVARKKIAAASVDTDNDSARPASQRGRVATFLATKVFVVVYYGAQLWLATIAFLSIATLSLGAIQIILLIVGILGIAKWIWRVTWPLVDHHARLMGAFQRLDHGILSGSFSGPESVAADVRKILPQISTGTPQDNRNG